MKSKSEHMYELFKEYELEDNDKSRLCFKLAYELGHASGEYEVEQHFENLVELIKD